MKTLKKFTINPEKVIKNEELVNLKGGMYKCWCWCEEEGAGPILCGPAIVGGTPGDTGCMYDCYGLYGSDLEAYWWTDHDPSY